MDPERDDSAKKSREVKSARKKFSESRPSYRDQGDRPQRPSRYRGDSESRPSYRDQGDRPQRPSRYRGAGKDDSYTHALPTSSLPQKEENAYPQGGIWSLEESSKTGVSASGASVYPKRKLKLPDEVQKELGKMLSGYQLRVSSSALLDALNAYGRERYNEAIRLLEVVIKHAPESVSTLELLGLSYYRVGNWLKAISLLERFHNLSDSCDQDPVICDSYRALKRWFEVDATWKRLKIASPSREVMAEGRIVYASSLAERQRLKEGISLLESAIKNDKHSDLVVVRQLYALGRLYEDSGNVSKAKLIYKDIVAFDKSLYDAAERVLALS